MLSAVQLNIATCFPTIKQLTLLTARISLVQTPYITGRRMGLFPPPSTQKWILGLAQMRQRFHEQNVEENPKLHAGPLFAPLPFTEKMHQALCVAIQWSSPTS